jgi:hypothetical protein
MNPFRWFVEHVFDLVWPPGEGDPPLSFRQKVVGVIVLVPTILVAVLLSRRRLWATLAERLYALDISAGSGPRSH